MQAPTRSWGRSGSQRDHGSRRRGVDAQDEDPPLGGGHPLAERTASAVFRAVSTAGRRTRCTGRVSTARSSTSPARCGRLRDRRRHRCHGRKRTDRWHAEACGFVVVGRSGRGRRHDSHVMGFDPRGIADIAEAGVTSGWPTWADRTARGGRHLSANAFAPAPRFRRAARRSVDVSIVHEQQRVPERRRYRNDRARLRRPRRASSAPCPKTPETRRARNVTPRSDPAPDRGSTRHREASDRADEVGAGRRQIAITPAMATT